MRSPLHVRTLGTGDPVVLLHGATLDAAWNWERPGIAPAIVQAGFRVVLPDLRGHGESERPTDPQALSLDAHTADALDLVDGLGHDRVPLVGYSLGSLIALKAAAQDRRIVGVFAGGLAMDYVHPEPLTPEREAWCDQLPPERAAFIRAMRLPRSVDFGAVTVPALVVTGDEEPPPDAVVDQLPDGRGARVRGDHSSALDDPALAALIVEFLATLR